jgi:hypothetical protein
MLHNIEKFKGVAGGIVVRVILNDVLQLASPTEPVSSDEDVSPGASQRSISSVTKDL